MKKNTFLLLFITILLVSIKTEAQPIKTDTSSNKNISINDIDFIEIYNMLPDRDSNLSNHRRLLATDQVLGFINKLNSAKIDSSNIYDTDFILMTYYKDGSHESYYIRDNVIKRLSEIKRKNACKIINDKYYFRQLWEDAYEESCDCEITVNLTSYKNKDNIIKQSKPYDVLDSYIQKKGIDGCFTSRIVKDSVNEFYIEAITNLPASSRYYLWIPKSNLVGTFLDNTDVKKGPLLIRERPIRKSQVISSINPSKELFRFFVVAENCSKGWLRVKFNWQNKLYEGWIEIGYYCSNPCSPCN